jgi:hypothetical protein
MSGFDYFLKYVGTLFKVMFHLQYHIDFCISILKVGKKSRGIHPIAIGEVTSYLIARTLVIQFKVTLMEHFNPH